MGEITSALFLSIALAVPIIYPVYRCFVRAGYSGTWVLLLFIPFVGPAMIFGLIGILACGQWPSVVGKSEITSWKALSANSWRVVSPEEAAENRYYGLEGWLLALFAASLASIPMGLPGMFSPAGQDIARQIHGLDPVGATMTSTVSVVWGAVFAILIPLKRPSVPLLLLAMGWVALALNTTIVLSLGTGTNTNLLMVVVPGTVSAIFMSWYWLQSKRVNVTYRLRVPK